MALISNMLYLTVEQTNLDYGQFNRIAPELFPQFACDYAVKLKKISGSLAINKTLIHFSKTILSSSCCTMNMVFVPKI